MTPCNMEAALVRTAVGDRIALIHLIRSRATKQQVEEMCQTLGAYIKLAVDVQRAVLAGGGELHADCEQLLLEDGSQQEDIWGADWYPTIQQATFEALINIRPGQNNRSMQILDPSIRERVAQIARSLLGEA